MLSTRTRTLAYFYANASWPAPWHINNNKNISPPQLIIIYFFYCIFATYTFFLMVNHSVKFIYTYALFMFPARHIKSSFRMWTRVMIRAPRSMRIYMKKKPAISVAGCRLLVSFCWPHDELIFDLYKRPSITEIKKKQTWKTLEKAIDYQWVIDLFKQHYKQFWFLSCLVSYCL